MDSHPTDRSSSNVTAIIAIFLGVIQAKQKALMEPLELSESQVSRKMHSGSWSVDDVARLARFFGVPVSDFFEDPEVIRRRMLGVRELPWMTTPPGNELDLTDVECEGQLDLLVPAA